MKGLILSYRPFLGLEVLQSFLLSSKVLFNIHLTVFFYLNKSLYQGIQCVEVRMRALNVLAQLIHSRV